MSQVDLHKHNPAVALAGTCQTPPPGPLWLSKHRDVNCPRRGEVFTEASKEEMKWGLEVTGKGDPEKSMLQITQKLRKEGG